MFIYYGLIICAVNRNIEFIQTNIMHAYKSVLKYSLFTGFVEVSLMHPLDLIKTRFQIQRGPDDPHRYTSLADCFKKMYRNEG